MNFNYCNHKNNNSIDSPSPPTNLSISYSNGVATLSWLPPVNDSNCIVQYTVYANESYLVATSDLDAIVAFHEGTINNYSITSVDTAGRVSGYSHILNIIWKGR